MRIGILFALILVASCGSPPRAETYLDSEGWFIAECPHSPDACVTAAEQHCTKGYLLADANAGQAHVLIRSHFAAATARREAESGMLRLRCVGTVIDESQ